MLTCREVAAAATDYLERSAPRAQRLAVWAHLRLCPNCRVYLRQLVRTIRLTRRSATAEPPPREVEEALAAEFAARGKAPGE
jgi:predicted anti-sigma-YlaC factor YlaD